MALEEVSFYTITGEEINITNIVNQFIDYYIQKRQIGETKITDFNEGSEIRNILEAFAVGVFSYLQQQNEDSKLPFIHLSYGEWLDRIGENPFIKLPRITGDVSVGEVTFTLKEEQANDFIIPAETLLTDSETGLDFVTVGDCIIEKGELSADVAVECLTEGSDGNSKSGDLNIISSENTDFNIDLLTVINHKNLENGSDFEDDEDYRERLLNNVQSDGFGSFGWYNNLCNSVKGVHDVAFFDHSTFTKKVLVNGNTKPCEDKVILDVLCVLTDVANKVINHNFTVEKVNINNANVDIVVNTTVELDNDMLKECLRKYVDGGDFDRVTYDGFNIGQDFNVSDVESAFNIFDGIVSVELQQDITVYSGQVLKLNEINITQNIV